MAALGFHAMGTDVVVHGSPDGGKAVRALFEVTEAVCSRFRPESDLERMNDAFGIEVAVPEALLEPIRLAAEMRERTDGLVDAGLGAAVAGWGYDRTFEDVGDLGEPGEVRAPRWELRGSTLFRSPGTRMDLGGIAKGWTVDRAVTSGLASVVSAGGDLRSTTIDTVLEVVDPWGRPTVRILLGRAAAATSAVTRRRWRVGATEAHHLIDPRTLHPADTPILSSTAVAATAVEAEAAAKAVLLLGTDGLAWAARQPWIRGAVVIWRDSSTYATAGMELEAA